MEGSETTVYVGNHYEKNLTTGRIVKYYSFGGRRVAMRRTGLDGQDMVYFIAGDHPSATLRTGLGTTSVVLNADGSFHSEARHYPYGEERWSSGSLPTDYRFTGQRLDSYTQAPDLATLQPNIKGFEWVRCMFRFTKL